MLRVIVHAGFYKTGSTSLQKHMAKLRPDLPSDCRYYGPDDFPKLGALARDFGQFPNDLRRQAFRKGLRRFLNDLPDPGSVDGLRTLMISRENFSGIMPGHRDVTGEIITAINPAAKMLARDLLGGLKRRFGTDCEISFLYVVRDTDEWLASVHGHQLRSTRMCHDLEAFKALFPKKFDLRQIADKIAQALAPVPVHIRQLEDYADHRHGPAGILLDLLEVPEELQAGWPAAKPANVGQCPDLRAQFLELNRQITDKEMLRQRKAALLEGT